MKPNLSIFTTFLCLLLVTAICGLHTLKSNNILPKLDVLLVGTNDIHGTAYPILLSRKDTGEKYTYGGLVYMARMLEILRK
jgi:hypothetical protein